MIQVILFVFGAIVGSFLNVVALRWNSGKGIGGRSSCATCSTELKWFELVPVFSYLFLGGKCRTCSSKISAQYALVEFSTGIIFASLFSIYGLTILYALAVLIFCIYIVVTVYDAKHKIIPDSLAYAAAFVALVFRVLHGGTVLDYLAGPILFTFFYCLWKFSHGRAVGLGDGKLALSIGLLLGFVQGLSAFAFAFWVGLLVAIIMMVYPLSRRSKRLTMKSEIPFAPFLVVGAWLALILHADIFHITSLFG